MDENTLRLLLENSKLRAIIEAMAEEFETYIKQDPKKIKELIRRAYLEGYVEGAKGKNKERDHSK